MNLARPRRNRPGRSIHAADARALIRGLNELSARGSFLGLRTRAIVFTAWCSALRASEVLALDIDQIRDTSTKRLKIREKCYIRTEQAKGSKARDWSSAGMFVIGPRARAALHTYIKEAIRRGWIGPELTGPLFVTVRGWHTGGHTRLKYRAHTAAWNKVCDRLQLPELYRFHDLRHDAISRMAIETGGNAYQVQKFGRFSDMDTVLQYVHVNEDQIIEHAKRAAA